MIYFENSSRGAEGFNTHLMSYTLCLSLSNFLERDFFFDYEIPSSTPPDYALKDEYKEKFKILLDSERSLVSDLIEMPAADLKLKGKSPVNFNSNRVISSPPKN